MGCVVSSGSGAASGGSRRGKVFPQAVPTEDDADFVQGEYERAQAKVALLADLLTSKASQVPITDRYNLQRGNIGSGAFAVVRRATDLETGVEVAVKTICLAHGTRESVTRAVSMRSQKDIDYTSVANAGEGSVRNGGAAKPFKSPSAVSTPRAGSVSQADVDRQIVSAMELQSICREIDLLGSIRHPCIVELKEYFVCPWGTRIHIILELLEGGDLKEFLSLRERDTFTEDEARIVSRRVISGLAYLHSLECVHRDLKPENLMLRERGNLDSVKIVDFGFARCTQLVGAARDRDGRDSASSSGRTTITNERESARATDLCRSVCGTPLYMAPEVMGLRTVNTPVRVSAVEGYSTPVDMWSYGVILYQMLSGSLPFRATTQEALFRQVAKGTYELDDEDWASISSGAKDFIRKLIVLDPRKRLKATEALLTDKWLGGSV